MKSKNSPSTERAAEKKPLAEAIIAPDIGIGCYFDLGKKHGHFTSMGMGGPKRAIRIVIYDAHEEYRARQKAAKKAADLKKLAELKAKYEKRR